MPGGGWTRPGAVAACGRTLDCDRLRAPASLSCKHIGRILQGLMKRGHGGRILARDERHRRHLGKAGSLSEEEMRKRLEMLRIEHRDLDAAIDALTAAGAKDQLQIARLKKRKLRLKDQISMLEDYLIPDIIA